MGSSTAELLGELGYFRGKEFDFEISGEGGRRVVEVKANVGGARDLSAAMTLLARHVESDQLKFAQLVVLNTSMSRARLEDEWSKNLALFRPRIATKLGLIAVPDGDPFTLSVDGDSERLLAVFSGRQLDKPRQVQHGRSYEVVLKVLLRSWLLGEGTVSRTDLQRATGFSYPTVATALKRLSPFLIEGSGRSVGLGSWPAEAWGQLAANAKQVRNTVYFRDKTGGSDPEILFDILKETAPPHVAVGGVYGALHYDSMFDLRGVPRLDLSVHVPSPGAAVELARTLDPALELVENHRSSHVLAVHSIWRAEPYFVYEEGDSVPWADPVEVLLDLDDMRLSEQLHELVRKLRSEHA